MFQLIQCSEYSAEVNSPKKEQQLTPLILIFVLKHK